MGQAQQLIVPGRFERLTEIAEFVTQAAREAGLNDDEVFHVEMAVDEACSNVIEHAYASQTGDIDLACTCPASGQFEVVIRDSGQPFDPAKSPRPMWARRLIWTTSTRAGWGCILCANSWTKSALSMCPARATADHAQTGQNGLT